LFEILQSEESGDSADKRKSRINRKHMIIGVTCALVVAMVIAGILVGVKFYLDSANEIVTVYLRLCKVCITGCAVAPALC